MQCLSTNIDHLVSVFFNKDDQTKIVGQRVGQLLEEDSKMGLVEIHRAVTHISNGIDDLLTRARSTLYARRLSLTYAMISPFIRANRTFERSRRAESEH